MADPGGAVRKVSEVFWLEAGDVGGDLLSRAVDVEGTGGLGGKKGAVPGVPVELYELPPGEEREEVGERGPAGRGRAGAGDFALGN